ncbi:hypothetical protein NB701_001976 [Pantoea ananatis]|nr:hypothetical protein [Pantoea ananatis]
MHEIISVSLSLSGTTDAQALPELKSPITGVQ